jgi:hypothetical protein
VSKNFSVTNAEIINHRKVGIGSGYYVEYRYYVNNGEYIKEVNYSHDFVDCYKTRACIGRKFLLFYDVSNPDKSFNDFSNEYTPCN